MKIKFLSYGHKFYEAEGKPAPAHDFLFSLRDLVNPYWVPELKDFHGLEKPIQEFFEADPGSQDRLQKLSVLVEDFINDFLRNKHRTDDCNLTFAFKCTGGRHRSVYFAQTVADLMQAKIKDSRLKFEVEHIDLPRYSSMTAS